MAFTVVVNDMLTEIQQLLLEEADGGLTYASGIYTAAEVVDRLNYRILDFYKRTNLIAKRDISISTEANIRDQDYPEDMIDVIRLGIEIQCE